MAEQERKRERERERGTHTHSHTHTHSIYIYIHKHIYVHDCQQQVSILEGAERGRWGPELVLVLVLVLGVVVCSSTTCGVGSVHSTGVAPLDLIIDYNNGSQG